MLLKPKVDDQLKYIGPEHPVLQKGEIYVVRSVGPGGASVRVITNTGFVGAKTKCFRIV